MESIYDEIAKDIAGKQPYLQCGKCGRKTLLNEGQIAEKLRSGWDECCGYIMRYYPG